MHPPQTRGTLGYLGVAPSPGSKARRSPLTLSPAIARALFDEPLTLAAAAAFEEDAARGGAYAGENPLNDTR